jgi:hypothetical protein
MLGIITLLIVLSPLPAAPPQGGAAPVELTFPTRETELFEFPLRDRGHELLTWDEYVELFEALPRGPVFIRIKQRPESLGANALYGNDVVFNGRNHSFAAVPRADGGFSIHVDANGNGDVLDDPVLQTEIHQGHPSAVFRAAGSVTVDGAVHNYLFHVRFVIRRFGAGFQLEQSLGYHLRRGLIDDGTSRVPFALLGIGGTFDKDRDLVFIDHDGNGMQLTRDSREQLLVADRRFNIGGASYSFRVDSLGRSLVLTPATGDAASRPELTPGTAVLSVEVVDISGRKHSLSSYRGRVVLLDFWAPGAVHAARKRRNLPRCTGSMQRRASFSSASLRKRRPPSERFSPRSAAPSGRRSPNRSTVPCIVLFGCSRIRRNT